jgi:hypothetical protein
MGTKPKLHYIAGLSADDAREAVNIELNSINAEGCYDDFSARNWRKVLKKHIMGQIKFVTNSPKPVRRSRIRKLRSLARVIEYNTVFNFRNRAEAHPYWYRTALWELAKQEKFPVGKVKNFITNIIHEPHALALVFENGSKPVLFLKEKYVQRFKDELSVTKDT